MVSFLRRRVSAISFSVARDLSARSESVPGSDVAAGPLSLDDLRAEESDSSDCQSSCDMGSRCEIVLAWRQQVRKGKPGAARRKETKR